MNAAAPHHLPSFITAPGGTDYLMVAAAVILIGAVLGIGLLFLRLHTLPERMAHKTHKIQFEIVAVLGLLALFTHVHAFWVAGLLLALIDLPDIPGMFGRMAGSLEKIADIAPGRGGDAASDAEAALRGPEGNARDASAGIEEKNHA
ncbi:MULTISPECIES: hypothetical protein [unclassified Bosea (in: a-proteobacteria)]|uniref:hypothetical protein n=1 Tax=unclassified Bosea (in: a-proteobacteria) TaxID=2653178 RepID=UPI000F759E51|nr:MULTISPECIES: hypothetical protein [unclassified Bosea (in: a-proteobacteria)]AZO81953.1 hypothetical protein BLM15_29560 [Bosea sp. Tri-49]RXT16732.1 hypothetical protein B5U98_27855 [Bosea sp. Tri-39]RXT42347.1 hypothetical protein B5U99_00065 [Bosea sp. Tri-54]